MTKEEALHKLRFMRDAYQKLIDENVDEGRFVGTDVTGTWKADMPLNEVYKEHVDALNLAITALIMQEDEKRVTCIEGGVYYATKNGVKVAPLITGGYQERSKRGGTSNVAGAVGLATALKLSRIDLEKQTANIRAVKDYFTKKVLSEIDSVTINGGENSLPGIVNITFNGIDGEALLYALDLKGVCASLGAACSAGTIEPSRVLKEIGLSDSDAKSSIRFSFYKQNTTQEADYAVEVLKQAIKKVSG